MKKIADVGFQCIWNEAPLIHGWAKTMLRFSKRVCAIVDPRTNDGTVKILKREFPQVEIVWQDLTLGDSDYEVEGPQRALIMHVNNTKFMEEEVDAGEWVLFLAADERFHPADFDRLSHDVETAKGGGKEAVIHGTFYDIYDDEMNYIANEPWIKTTQFRFFVKPESRWVQNPGPHEGKSWVPKKVMYTRVPFFHFGFLKHKKKESWVYSTAGDVLKQTIERGGIMTAPYRGKPFPVPREAVPELAGTRRRGGGVSERESLHDRVREPALESSV